MNLYAGQQWRNRQREQTQGHWGRGGGQGELYGESNMETYNNKHEYNIKQTKRETSFSSDYNQESI